VEVNTASAWSPSGLPPANLSTSPPSQNAQPPFLGSSESNNVLAFEHFVPNQAQLPGGNFISYDAVAISIPSISQDQQAASVSARQDTTDHVDLSTADPSIFAFSDAGFMFDHIPDYQAMNGGAISVGEDNLQQEAFTMMEMPLRTGISILPIETARVQSKTRYHCIIAGCDRSTARRADLQRHMRSKHSAGKYICKICLQPLSNRADKIKSHLVKYHKFDRTVLQARRDLWDDSQ
jgi:hypothetical protein